jgi:hypothetical protein
MLMYVNKGIDYTAYFSLAKNPPIPIIYTLTKNFFFFIILSFQSPKILMEKLHPVYFHVSLNILYNYTPFLDQQYITFPRVNELLVKYTGSRDVFSVESSRQ